jgi:glycosyltransferase involved in cell wall biosynthesis
MLNDWAMRFRAYKKIPYWYVVERHTVRRASWIHFATEEERRQAQAWVGGQRSKVIPIGLDLQEFSALPTRGEFRDRYRIPRDVPVLASLGRIHPIKGLDVLLQALVRVKAEIPEIILAIAGPDEDGHRSELEQLAQSLGIDGHLCWLGTIEEKAKLGFLVDADVFVLPSFSENFGLAAVEAMAVGCPVIVGRGVNIASEVEAYGAGWVVATEAETLASAIVKALRNPEARRGAGMAGQHLVADRYDGEAVAREMLKAYEECLQ